jgi:dTMP kinase
LLFDVPLEVARQRLDAHRTLDKFEKEKQDFFAATRAAYLQRAAQFPARIRVIDSTQSIAAVNAEIDALIASMAGC